MLERALVQWLEHDLFAKVVSTFADHALASTLIDLVVFFMMLLSV
jgi:hypothetical protein